LGKLAEIKTKETDADVEDFLKKIKDDQKRKDSFELLKMMKKTTGLKPKIWGNSIIGFGKLIYKSPATEREVEWFKIGFSPRKANLSVYLMDLKIHETSLKKLGKHKLGSGCLYINKLSEIDLSVLEKIITVGFKRKQ